MRTDTLSWVAADGTVTQLTQQAELDVHWALGVEGRFMPPVRMIEEQVPQQHGARLRGVRYEPREVTLPLSVIGASEQAVRAKIRALGSAFDPTRGDGWLRVVAADGTSRELRCRYSAGMEGEESRDSSGARFQRLVAVFRAVEPFWRDTAASETSYAVETGGLFLGNPFLRADFGISSDTVLGAVVVNNGGDLSAEPVYTFVGPASSVTITNVATGEVLQYAAAIALGKSVIIDTSAGIKSVLGNDGANLYANLSLTSSLFTLPRGATSINLAMPGSDANSYVTVSYRRRWLMP